MTQFWFLFFYRIHAVNMAIFLWFDFELNSHVGFDSSPSIGFDLEWVKYSCTHDLIHDINKGTTPVATRRDPNRLAFDRKPAERRLRKCLPVASIISASSDTSPHSKFLPIRSLFLLSPLHRTPYPSRRQRLPSDLLSAIRPSLFAEWGGQIRRKGSNFALCRHNRRIPMPALIFLSAFVALSETLWVGKKKIYYEFSSCANWSISDS